VKFFNSVDKICFGVKTIEVENVENEYYTDIYNYLKSRPKHCELKDLPGKNISVVHRNTLIKWLLELTIETKKSDYTFQLAVILIDKCLSLLKELKVNAFQLVGITCYLLASKMNCVEPIEVETLIWYSSDICKAEVVKEAEGRILNLLNYELSIPTIQELIGFHLSMENDSENIWGEVRMLANKALCDYRYCQWTPDELAEACVNYVLKKEKEDECAEFIASMDK